MLAMSDDVAAARANGELELDGIELAFIAALVALTVIVFANAMRGDFLFDDNRQIVRNELIRDPHRWRDALTHDVWAFKGERDDRPWSNYWRPGHVAWMMLNVRLFGAGDPLPWHLTSLLAHLGVIVAGYVFLRGLGVGRGATTAIVGIFAIHPTRCESVVWIAGVHDVLCTLCQLLALLCAMSAWNRPPRQGALVPAIKWTFALLLYALAIATKEIAIFFPAILALVRWTDPRLAMLSAARRLGAALVPAAPFVLIAIMFLIARHAVLVRTQLDYAFKPTWPT